MKIRRGILSLYVAASALFFVPAALADCTPQASMPVSYATGRHLATTVRVNGTALKLIVDTGAPFSALTPEAIQKLGLESKPYPKNIVRMFYGGARMDRFVSVRTLTFQDAAPVTADFMVAPAGRLHKDVDGVIGMDVLEKFDAEFDFALETLKLHPPGSCATDPKSWLYAPDTASFGFSPTDRQIRIPVQIDGKDIAGLIDTGMPNSRISMDSAKTVFGLSENSEGMVKFGFNPLHTFYRYPFKTLTIGASKVNDPGISIDPFSRSGTNAFQAILGLNVLNHFRLYFDAKNDMLYMSPRPAKP